MRARALSLAILVAAALVGACRDPSPPPSPPASASAHASAPAPALAPPLALARASEVREGARLAVAHANGKRLFVVSDEDARAVLLMDGEAGTVLGKTSLSGRPGPVLVLADGRVAVALRDEAAVSLLRARTDYTLTEEARLATDVEPVALAATPDDRTLFVASGWSSRLQGFDVQTAESRLSVPVAREPRAIVALADRVVVTHAAASVVEAVATDGGKVASEKVGIPTQILMPMCTHFEVLDRRRDDEDGFGGARMHGFRRCSSRSLPAREARQAFGAVVFEGKDGARRVVVPMVQVLAGDTKVVTAGYGGGFSEEQPTELFDVATLDAQGAHVGHAMLPAATCRLPRAAARAGTQLAVACLGSDTVLLLDPAAPTEARRTVKVTKPVALAADEGALFALADFGRTVVRVDGTEPVAVATLPAHDVGEEIALGRALFHTGGDPRVAADGRSCAGCHPDGRDDGLVWSTPNGPRQTLTLMGRVSRGAPFGWQGAHASMAVHMRATLKNLGGRGLEARELDALGAYVASMRPPGGRKLALGDEEARGKEIFESSEAGCASCHDPKDGFTDHQPHDVRSAGPVDVQRSFLVPALAGVSHTAPYFHDGRFATLDEMLAKTNGTMGQTKHLGDADRRALVAYLKTL